MNRQDYINQIISALAFLSKKVEISSALNLTDINIHAEDFYKDLLNLSLGYNLVNMNSITPNATAIDLGDKENRIAIQVTSTSKVNKTRQTVEKFINKKLYNDYDRLIILNIAKLTKHREPSIGQSDKYELDTKRDMWDYKEFCRKILNKDTKKIKQIADFLANELKIFPKENTSITLKTLFEKKQFRSVIKRFHGNVEILDEDDIFYYILSFLSSNRLEDIKDQDIHFLYAQLELIENGKYSKLSVFLWLLIYYENRRKHLVGRKLAEEARLYEIERHEEVLSEREKQLFGSMTLVTRDGMELIA